MTNVAAFVLFRKRNYIFARNGQDKEGLGA